MKTLTLFLSLTASQLFAATDIYVIQHSRTYIEASRRDGVDVLSALDHDVGTANQVYLVIARRNDCWVGQASSSLQRAALIRTATGIVQETSQRPTYISVDRWVSNIKQEVLRRSGGIEMPRIHYLAPPNAGPESGDRPSIDAEDRQGRFGRVGAGDPRDQDHPFTDWPRILMTTFLIALSASLGGRALIRFRRNKAARELTNQTKLDSLRQRVDTKSSEIADRFPELKRELFLNVLLLTFLIPLSSAFGQENFVSIRMLDVSITFHPMHRLVKSELALSLANGRPFELVIFGDSVRDLGKLQTFSQLDSIFARLPRDHNTRIADAFSWLALYTDSLRATGVKPTVAFFSDWRDDDNGNKAIANGFLAFPHTTKGQYDTLAQRPPAEAGFSFQRGLLCGVIGSASLFGIIGVIRGKRRKAIIHQYKTLLISTPTGQKEFSLDQVRDRKLKVGPEIDSDIRTFGSQEFLLHISPNGSLTLRVIPSGQKTDTLTITLKKEI